MAYNAIIVRLKDVRPHPKADRVQLATCCGNQIVVGLDDKENALGIYFSADGQLSQEFCHQNNLFRDQLKNKNKDAKPGMFDDNGRVRAQKFRGEISDGFWMPMSCLNYITTDSGKYPLENYEFCKFEGIEICNKYVNQATMKVARENLGKRTKVAKKSIMFKEHFDTAHFGKNLHVFGYGQFIIVTEKVHGCVKWDTKIETLEKGTLTIKEIVNNKLNVKIKALDILTNEIVYVPIDDFYTIQDDGDWYEIELEDGRIIVITGNNPVWLPELNCYRAVEDLNGNETLLVD